jgi:SOS response regulatory protein OraA/RecX
VGAAGAGDASGPHAGRGRPRAETHVEARARRAAIDDPETVLAAAARLLESRSRTVHEVRSRLTDAGYRADLVDATVERLQALGYLDDEEFARAWVASRDRAHPRGERALRAELGRKGVDRETVDAVLAERADAAEEAGADLLPDVVRAGGRAVTHGASADETAASRLLERRRAALERVADPRTRRQKAYALLARSGFDPGTCAEVAARFVAGAAEG